MKTLALTLSALALLAPSARAGELPTPTKAPALSQPEARRELRKLWFTYFEQVNIAPHFDCRNTAPDRVACNVWLRFPGSDCVSRSAVVETADDYHAVIRDFNCRANKKGQS